jgi:pimeloyl-ACP methyl ester carboxylesterase
MPYADSEGYRIHFEVAGAGRPVVLVHGWGSDLVHNWRSTGWVDALAARFRVLALDVRGHGRSDKPHVRAAYGYRALSRDVLAVMDHAGAARAALVGYSMGAFMGVCLLADAPSRFSAMVLGGIGDETTASAGACHAIAAALRAPAGALPPDPLGRAARAFVESNPRNDDLEALALSALAMWPEGFPLALAGPHLARADVPVLVVNGSEDRPYVLSDERLVAALRRARLVRIPGCDHLAAAADPRFRDVALEFLSANA